MNQRLKFLRKRLTGKTDQAQHREVLLDQMLVAYRQEARNAEAIDGLERTLKARLRFLPRHVEEFNLSLDAAILSLRGWLLAFSAVALILFSLSLADNFSKQPNHGTEEVLTFNAESTPQDPIAVSGEQEYGR